MNAGVVYTEFRIGLLYSFILQFNNQLLQIANLPMVCEHVTPLERARACDWWSLNGNNLFPGFRVLVLARSP